MNRLLLIGLLALSDGAFADTSDDVYETLDESRLGRLFLNSSERLLLERRRGLGDTSESTSELSVASDERVVTKTPSRGTGIIVSRDREPLLWVDGEFRRRRSASTDELRVRTDVLIWPTRVAPSRSSREVKNDASGEDVSERTQEEGDTDKTARPIGHH